MPDPNTPDTPTDQGASATTAIATAADVQAQIAAALAKQKAEIDAGFSASLEQATGHKSLKELEEKRLQDEGKLKEIAENKEKEAEKFRGKFHKSTINAALLAASTDAVDPKTISDLLANKAVCDEDGNVTIDGKPATEAVTALLKERPFLAKPQGIPGSGASTTVQTTQQQQSQIIYADAAKKGDVMAMLKHNTGVKS
jgi:hypothetical protein